MAPSPGSGFGRRPVGSSGKRTRRCRLGIGFSKDYRANQEQDPSMSNQKCKPQAILMIAYTDYQSDPRVLREAEAAAAAGFEVDFLALRSPGDPPVEDLRGVRVFHLAQSRYRGGGHLKYVLA